MKDKKERKNTELIQLLKENYQINSVKDIQEALKDIFKDTLQEVMDAEFENHMGYPKNDMNSEKDNYRNGSYEKKLRSTSGSITLDIPRDRNALFDPQLVPKHKRDVSDLEEKIIVLYGRGMSTRDITDEIRDLYGIELSATMISNITNAIMPRITEWQNRVLHKVYPIVFIDAIHFSVREDSKISKKAAYIALAYDTEGMKDILGIWIGENESAKFWLSVLNDLKNRGVLDIFLICSDNLTGIKEAINAAYPKAIQQRCIIHIIRNSVRYVNRGDYKKFCGELKTIYTAVNEKTAFEALNELEDKWGKKFPSAVSVWKRNWAEIVPMFLFSPDLRKIVYTTNTIENLNRGIRKYTKTKSVFPNTESLQKAIYLSIQNITNKWTMRFKNWDRILNELEILFPNRMDI